MLVSDRRDRERFVTTKKKTTKNLYCVSFAIVCFLFFPKITSTNIQNNKIKQLTESSTTHTTQITGKTVKTFLPQLLFICFQFILFLFCFSIFIYFICICCQRCRTIWDCVAKHTSVLVGSLTGTDCPYFQSGPPELEMMFRQTPGETYYKWECSHSFCHESFRSHALEIISLCLPPCLSIFHPYSRIIHTYIPVETSQCYLVLALLCTHSAAL